MLALLEHAERVGGQQLAEGLVRADPGMRQRTSRPSECVSAMRSSFAAVHRRSGEADERRP